VGKNIHSYRDSGRRPRGILLWNVFGQVDAARELIRAGALAARRSLGATALASDLYLDTVLLDARHIASHRLLCGPSQQGSGRDVELAAVAGAGHDRTFEIAAGKRALEVRARIAEGVECSSHIRDRDLHAADLERRQLTFSDVLCACDLHELTHGSRSFACTEPLSTLILRKYGL
jgi:hypothetical protein